MPKKPLPEALLQEWHPTKNGDLLSVNIPSKSAKKVWWLCSKGHEWEAIVSNRTRRNTPCPYCSGKKVTQGVNDLATINPLLASEWHPTKNGDLTPFTMFKNSTNKVWWQCSKGHEWEAVVYSRSTGNDCPFCAGKLPIVGVNDLATFNPVLAEEWHPTKNGSLTIYEITHKSNKKVWWLGKCGHEWEGAPNNRTTRGCPFCSSQKILVGFNDLATVNPELASEWHPTKNYPLTAQQCMQKSSKKIWWLCKAGHEWKTFAYSRGYGNGCQQCSRLLTTSKPEKEICDYLLSKGFVVEQNNRSILNGQELDLYILSEKFAIEFNGVYWHTETSGKSKTYHYNKWLECQEKGIQLIQIWDDDWRRDKSMIFRAIDQKIDTNNKQIEKITILEITSTHAEEFMKTNHVENFSTGDYYLGSFNLKNELNAVIILAKESHDVFSIIRYASTKSHTENFVNLIDHIQEKYPQIRLTVIDDNCMSDSHIYEENGFTIVEHIEPDYMGTIGSKRYNKDDKKLLNKKLSPIWDAGKTRWIRKPT